jgi:beta-xylosidase/AraC-like DNA-binding protein
LLFVNEQSYGKLKILIDFLTWGGYCCSMTPNTAGQFRGAKMNTAEARIYHLTKPLVHSDSDLEVVFVLDGKLTIRSGPETYHLKRPDVLVLNPQGGLQKTSPGQIRLSPLGDCFFLFVRIGPSFLSSAFGDIIPVFDCDSSAQDKNFGLLRGILAEIASADTVNSGNGLLFYSRLYRLLDELAAHFVKPGAGIPGGEGDDGIRRQAIHGYIEKNFRFTVGLDELAGFLSLSPQYLSRYFKKLFGVNFHTYITRFRLEKALRELTSTDNPVTAIAYDNGFPNLGAFIKEMKEELGQTPAAYRQARREKTEARETAAEDAVSAGLARIKDSLTVFLEEKKVPSHNQKRISADAAGGASFTKPWQEVINLGFVRDIEKDEFMDQIRLIQKEAPFRYARFQGLFGKSMFSSNEKSEYHFIKIDRIIDLIYQAGLLPFIELGYKLTNVAKRSGTFVFDRGDEREDVPNGEYENVIAHFLKHAVNRYGMQEVSRWRFEYWFPADEQQNYPDKDVDIYARQFSGIKNTIKKIIPAAMVGGPGFVKSSDPESIKNLIKKLAAENCLPDFFSCYVFSAVRVLPEPDGMNNTVYLWAKDDSAKRIAWIKDCVENLYRDLNNEGIKNSISGLFFVTEWNIDFSCRNLIHDSLLKASFILQNSIDSIDQVDVLSYWLASDISAEYTDSDAPLFGGPGLISRHGIRKPAFFAYQFLSKLGDKLLAKGNGYIVTAKSEHEFAVILFNYKYINSRFRFADQIRAMSGDLSGCLEDRENYFFSLEIRNAAPGRYRLRQHILNSHYGSVYDTWLGLSAMESLQSSETAWLERTCVPSLRIDFLESNGSLSIECDLEPNEARLLEISLILE